MSTCHIQHQSILTMILILASFLLVIHNIIINPNKFLDKSLLLGRVLTTGHRGMPLTKNLVTVTMHILNRSRTGLIIEHVEYLAEILGLVHWTTITYKEEHDAVGMVLGLDVFIHPYLAQNVNRLNTKTLTDPMS
ncbi:AC5 [French bean leaf curl virus]|uniref:AC5 n=1 Tax=French bean leaf curl virus TaxID=2050584 RepID=I6SJ03_9GEMI|nr:AC5 [French bean leaf curl virus]AFM77722.1 AC5 [French bean leaf curl virus]